MINRVDIIQTLINKFKYKSYLEIGVAGGECFNSIICDMKVGVDPRLDGPATVRLSSDTYFEQYSDAKFDIIFIDGLHHSDQVTRDIQNSLNALNSNGTIVMHDCSPTTEYMQLVPCPVGINEWTGDVWKSVVQFRQEYTYETFVVDTDLGVGIIRPNGPAQNKLVITDELIFDNLVKNRSNWLNLITPEAFNNWIANA